MTARQIIKKEYGKSKNFMTPHILRYGKISKNVAYELSKGTGFKHETIYGVSIVTIDKQGNTKREFELSKKLDGILEAEGYIGRLRERGEIE